VAASRAMGAMTRKFLLRELSYFGNLVATVEARQQCLKVLTDAGRLDVDLVDSVEYVSLN